MWSGMCIIYTICTIYSDENLKIVFDAVHVCMCVCGARVCLVATLHSQFTYINPVTSVRNGRRKKNICRTDNRMAILVRSDEERIGQR